MVMNHRTILTKQPLPKAIVAANERSTLIAAGTGMQVSPVPMALEPHHLLKIFGAEWQPGLKRVVLGKCKLLENRLHNGEGREAYRRSISMFTSVPGVDINRLSPISSTCITISSRTFIFLTIVDTVPIAHISVLELDLRGQKIVVTFRQIRQRRHV